jgi:tRNA (guanine37-N1)-methyltransferase
MARLKGLKKELAKAIGEEVGKLSFTIDIVGDIAIIKSPIWLSESSSEKMLFRKIGDHIIKRHDYIKSVWLTATPVGGEYRVRNLLHLAGEDKTETIYREHGCSFRVDIKDTYISPRLSYEHIRIAKLVREDEVIVNMFAGVGGFSIIIAKNSDARLVYSIDKNPKAYQYMVENIRLNKVEGKVKPFLGDSREIIVRYIVEKADRVLMPLPGLDKSFYVAALKSLRNDRGFLHVYEFSPLLGDREETVRRVYSRISEWIDDQGLRPHLSFWRIVRSVGPRRVQLVLDIEVTKK